MCHVLIIEDEPLVAIMLEDILMSAGADTVDIAVTQRDAIAAAENKRPDFISSDVVLPDGSGPVAVNEIIAAHGEIPVLFITGTPDSCKPCQPPGKIITKPFNATVVAESFKEMLA